MSLQKHEWPTDSAPAMTMEESLEVVARGPRLEGRLDKKHATSGVFESAWAHRWIRTDDTLGVVFLFKTPLDVERGTPSRVFPYSIITDVGIALRTRRSYVFDVKFGESLGFRFSTGSKAEQQKWITGLQARATLSKAKKAAAGVRADAHSATLVGVGVSRYVEVSDLATCQRCDSVEFVNRTTSQHGVLMHEPCWGSSSPLCSAGIQFDEVIVAVDGETILSHAHASRLIGTRPAPRGGAWSDDNEIKENMHRLLVSRPFEATAKDALDIS